MSKTQITVAKRFLGPPNSANGGYVSGLLAAGISGTAEVTLHRPPPLGVPLLIRSEADGAVLYDGPTRLASAIPAAAPEPGLSAVSIDMAAEAARRTFPTSAHPLPGCFVCGPERREGDGLRIHVGPVQTDDPDWQGLLAANWTPHETLADNAGRVRTEFLWAALDCPTGYAVSNSRGMRSVLLGRQTVSVLTRPRVGEALVVAARKTGSEGRKRFADSALFSANGELIAGCRAIWIDVSPAAQQGLPG